MNLVEIRCRHCRRVLRSWKNESELPDDVPVVRVDPCVCTLGAHRPYLSKFTIDGTPTVVMKYRLLNVAKLRKEMATARRRSRTQRHDV